MRCRRQGSGGRGQRVGLSGPFWENYLILGSQFTEAKTPSPPELGSVNSDRWRHGSASSRPEPLRPEVFWDSEFFGI